VGSALRVSAFRSGPECARPPPDGVPSRKRRRRERRTERGSIRNRSAFAELDIPRLARFLEICSATIAAGRDARKLRRDSWRGSCASRPSATASECPTIARPHRGAPSAAGPWRPQRGRYVLTGEARSAAGGGGCD